MRKSAKKALLFALIITVSLAAFGCQPNPIVPPIVGKGNLEQEIKDKSPAPSSDAANAAGAAATATPAEPQNVQQTIQSGKLTVNVDAGVQLPAAGKLPVIKVEPQKFTQEEATNIIKVLFQGKQAYNIKEKMSKADIEKQLVDMQAMKSQASGQYKDKILQKLDAGIKYLQDQLKTAPDTVPLVASDGKLKTDDLGGQEINAITSLGRDNDASLDIYNSKSGRTCSVWFTNEDEGTSYLGHESKLDGQPRGVKMTADEAKALAEKIVSDLGSDLKFAGISVSTQRGGLKTPANDPNAPQCYLLAFTREVNGVPTIYETNDGGSMPQEEIDKADAGGQYIEPHPYERIVMAIDDSGILEFQWQSPDKVLGTVSSDAQTLPFSQIMDTFQKQFFLRNALPSNSDAKPSVKGRDGGDVANNDPGTDAKNMRGAGYYSFDSIGYVEDVKSCTFHIDRITLGLSRIAEKDNPNEFLTVPVWDFFGTLTVEYTPESGYAGFTTTDTNTSFLTINAIDGSIINRSYGY